MIVKFDDFASTYSKYLTCVLWYFHTKGGGGPSDFRHPTWTYYKVFEKMPKKCGKNEGENYFFPLWCLIQKLDHNSGLLAKNQREISSNKVGRLLWP